MQPMRKSGLINELYNLERSAQIVDGNSYWAAINRSDRYWTPMLLRWNILTHAGTADDLREGGIETGYHRRRTVYKVNHHILKKLKDGSESFGKNVDEEDVNRVLFS